MPGSAIVQAGPLRGRAIVPGDKSISHRALIAGARCVRPLRVANLNPGLDVRATRDALVALGVGIESSGDDVVVRAGPLRSPAEPLACANSGSTARMLLGVCAGADVHARFEGDASLRSRPMEPVAAQLRAFGAAIETTFGHLPLEIDGTREIQTRRFILLAPSAQVKSALLFAGLFAGVGVSVEGDSGTRDHTERLLHYLGADVEWDGRSARLGTAQPRGGAVSVAGDLSSAAFFIAAAAIVPGSAVLVCDVGANPARTGLLEALSRMGARLELRNERSVCGEPIADVYVEHRPLAAAEISAATALRAIDEIPLIALAAAFAPGTTRIDGVGALRSKESDRIATVRALLAGAGVEARAERDALVVCGGTPKRFERPAQTHGDHRIAMTAAVLGAALGPIEIDDAGCIAVSFPDFLRELARLQR